MPITILIPGGASPGYVTTLQAAFGSIEVSQGQYAQGFQSIDIIDVTDRSGYSSMEILNATTRQALSSESIVYIDRIALKQTGEIVAGPSFLMLIDAIQEGLSSEALADLDWLEINAELRVNDVIVPIQSFDYQVPTGRLGSILNIKLADPDEDEPEETVIPLGASIDFDIIVGSGDDEITFKLLDNGKLQGRESKVAFQGGRGGGPKDELNFSSLDVIADKFTLAPRRSVVMYDPDKEKYTEVAVKVQDLVRDDKGLPIYPVIEPVYGLTSMQVMQRAYTGVGGRFFTSALSPGFISSSLWTSRSLVGPGSDQVGMGFDKVITNVPPYKMKRADFPLQNSWQSGVEPAIGMFNCIYFVMSNWIYVIDTDRKLPAGLNAYFIPISNHKVLSEKYDFTPDANAVLLRYQYSPFDEGEDVVQHREIIDDQTTPDIDDADRLADGYTETRTKRVYVEVYLASDPDTVLDTYDKSLLIQTFTNLVWTTIDEGTGTPSYTRRRGVLTHEEETEYQYLNDLLTDYTKRVKSAVYYDFSVTGTVLQDVTEETCRINWIDDPTQVGRKVQETVVTEVVGWTYIDPDAETIDDSDGSEIEINRQYPILLAQASGIIDRDQIDEHNWVPISREVKTLRRIKGNQFNVDVVFHDLINNTNKRSTSSPVVGSNFTDPYATRSREQLFRDLESEAEIGPRVPVSINAYELPRDMAMELKDLALARMKKPPRTMPIEMATIDFAIDRGSIVTAERRASNTKKYMVTGWSLSGTNLGTRGHRISQRLEAQELLSD